MDPSPVIPSDLSFGYLSAELKSPVKIPILDAVARLATAFKWEITGDLTWDLKHNMSLVMTNSGISNFHTETGLSYEITEILKLKLSFKHDYVLEPVADQDGRLPKNSDLQSIASLWIELR